MHILIDGYNLIRKSETLRQFDRMSLEAGRNALMRNLADYKKRTGHRVTVVFDAAQGGFLLEERDRHGGVQCLFSRKGETADDLIKRMVEDRKDAFVVVTSDRGIADFASRRGVAVIASPLFASRLHGGKDAPRDVASQLKDDTDDNGQDDACVAGTKKKGPSRRLSKRQKAARSVIRKL
jgi:hypothetical protein